MNAEPPHRPGDRSAPEEGYGIELAPVGLLVAASDGHVIATNQAWSELSDLSGPDSAGQGFLAALAPAERPRFQDDLRPDHDVTSNNTRTSPSAKTLNGSLPALSGLSILTHKNKKKRNTLNFNPNGESDVSVDLENNRPPANMLERLLRTWPEMDRS